ncbi:MAG: hypothetical protein RL701_7126 [Pseudomonadota bacterium]|jgi:ribosome-associated translation inhibitor RaiA
MQRRLQITLHGIEASPTLDARVAELATSLERFADQILSCHVTLQVPHRHMSQQGQRYDVRIRVCVPGTELVVARQGGLDPSRDDAFVAIRDAFEIAARRLDERARRSGRCALVKNLAPE